MARRNYEIVDVLEEKQRAQRRKFFFLSILFSLCVFAYPHIRDYQNKWRVLQGARRFGLFVQGLKTKAVLDKQPFEVRFIAPRSLEIFKVGSCAPNADRVKIADHNLSEFSSDIEMIAPQKAKEFGEPALNRFCYDPLYGSSVFAEGYLHAAVFFAYSIEQETQKSDSIVRVVFIGMNGDLEFE